VGSEDLEKKAERAFAEVERRKQEEEQAAVISLDDLLNHYDQIFTVYVPEIGFSIRYKKLTVKDFAEVAKEEDSNRRAVLMLYKMWSKADSSVTLDKLEKLPFDVVTVILMRILEKTPFLGINREQLKKQLRAGLGRLSGS